MEAISQHRNLDPTPRARKTNHTPAVLSNLNCTLTRDIKLLRRKTAASNCCLPGVLLQHEKGNSPLRWQHMGPGQLMLLMASRLGLGGKRVAYGVWGQEHMVRQATVPATILTALYCIARAHDSCYGHTRLRTVIIWLRNCFTEKGRVLVKTKFTHRFVPT